MAAATAKECELPSGVRAVRLENEQIAVTVLPDKGADIYSIEYKAKDHVNVLYRSPRGPRKPGTVLHPGTSEEQWMDDYLGGWQFLFPNAGAECCYKGATQAFHGEASSVPWEYRMGTCSEQTVSVIFSTSLARTPFTVEKTVTLHAGESVIRVKDRITNWGSETVDYVWGQHIAFGAPFLSDQCTLHVPNHRITSDRFQNGPHYRLAAGETTQWPMATTKSGERVDFSKVPSMNTRSVDMAYLTGMKDGWYVLSNEERQLNVGVSWDLEVFPYIWLWQEFGGSFGYPFYGRCYVMGVEPCSTPIADGLTSSVERGYASSLSPGESRETEIAMVLFAGAKPVKRITKEGKVIY